MGSMLAEHLLKQQVYDNHACTAPAEAAGDGDEMSGCCLPIHEKAAFTTVEPAPPALAPLPWIP